MNKYQQKHIITLSSRQKNELQTLTRQGTRNARVILRARMLLKSAEGWKDADIAEYTGSSIRTIEHVRAHFAQGGLERALYDAPRSGQPKKLDESAEAHLVALACSDPPKGRDHWTLELLQKQMVNDKKVAQISTVALWHRLRAHDLKPWREKNVVRPEPHGAIH